MTPSTVLFRIAHRGVWDRHPSPNFKNRFDDPNRRKQTLYACSQRLGAFIECLAPFRPSKLVELSIIRGANDQIASGIVPRAWLNSALLGRAQVDGEFADIYGADWINRLRSPLAQILQVRGFDDLDASVLQQARYRDITQAASREVRFAGLNGIYYRSRHGHQFENWAIFEPWSIKQIGDPELLSEVDPDLLQALSLLILTIDK